MTKAELENQLKASESEVAELKSRLIESEALSRRHRGDSERHEVNWKREAEKVRSIQSAIIQELQVKHKVGPELQQEFFRGKYVDVEEETPEVRFLRWLIHLTESEVPF